MKQKEYNGFVHLYLIKGNIHIVEDDGALIQLTMGYKMPYFKELIDMKTRIYFEYGKDKYFYFDKEYKYIYFLVNDDDITLLKSLTHQHEDKGE